VEATDADDVPASTFQIDATCNLPAANPIWIAEDKVLSATAGKRAPGMDVVMLAHNVAPGVIASVPRIDVNYEKVLGSDADVEGWPLLPPVGNYLVVTRSIG
jgi:hypothetical protein